MLRLNARRKAAIIDKRSSDRYASRNLEPPHFLRHLVHDLCANLPPSLNFHDEDSPARLHKKVDLASLATLRPTLPIRRSGQNERTFYAKMSEKVSYMVYYKVFKLISKL